MGLFDNAVKGWNNLTKEVQKGWNSFEKNELQQATNWFKDNTDLDEKVVDYIKEDPSKAVKTVEDPAGTALTQIYKVTHGEKNVSPILDDSTFKTVTDLTIGGGGDMLLVEKGKAALEQGIKESTQPIWERDSTKKILGEDGADKLQDVFNPARWVENTIDKTPIIPDNAKDTVKTYLPIVAVGAGALLLLSALKG